MGFDNECIDNIQSLSGEYFCPVCRLLVNPNEALQSQCTHLYCKPCLSYIANGTRACPYDGYLVTESDSKLLTESNKALAETIGKVPVHCLYHRSGCAWQGSLSECLNHCPGCSFGNSPVMCNRCGIQIVHRQVQEHAQSCPGVQPQTHATEGSQLASVANIADQSLTTKNAGTSISHAPISQTVTPGPVLNQQIMTSAQVPGAGQSTVPTSEQWYQQQQYQQYYQQFVGYDPYQQQYQQFYPYLVPQPQVHVQLIIPSQSLAQSQSQAQPQPQTSFQGQPPGQHQLPLQSQPHAPAIAAAPLPNTQVQSTMPPLSQLPSQVQSSQPVAFPFSQPASNAVQYPNQPFMQAQAQVLPNQQSKAQMPQPAVQPMINSSLQRQPSMLPQMPSQTQPAAAISHFPMQANQQVMAQTQAQYPLAQAITGYHSYPQPQPPLAPSGAPQPQPMLINPNMQPHLAQNQAQFPQPSPQVRPFQSHVAVSSQQPSSMLPSPAQLTGVPPAQLQPLHPQSQQPGHPIPHLGVMQQYPQHISLQLSHAQQPPFGGQSTSVQNSQTSIHQQLPMQSQLHPPGPQSFPAQMQHGAYPQLQPNAATSHNFRAPHRSAILMGRPTLPSLGPPLKFPQMDGPANSQVMVPGFNRNMVNSRGALHPPSEQHSAGTLHSKPENSASGQHLDPLSNATIRRDASSSLGADSSLSKMVTSETHSKHLNDGYKGTSEVGESKQSDASVYENQEAPSTDDSKDIARQTAVREGTGSNRLDGRLGEIGDRKDVPAILKKVEEKSIQEDDKSIDGPSLLQEDEKSGVRMVSSLKDSGNETKGLYPSGPEEKNLAHAQALVNSFGRGMGGGRGEDVLQLSQPDLHIEDGRNRNLLLHNGPSSVPSSIHPDPVGPSHQPHLSGLSVSHHGAPGFENSMPGQAQKMPHGNFSGGVPHFAPSELVDRLRLPGTDGVRGHKYHNSALEAGKYFNPRLGYGHLDGGTPDPLFLGNMEPGIVGMSSDIHSNRSRVTGPPGVDPILKSFSGDRSDWTFIEPPQHGHDRTVNQDERRKIRGTRHDSETVTKFDHFHSGRPFNRGLDEKSFDGHNLDRPGAIAASSWNYYPYGRTSDVGERPFGHPDDHIQRLSSFRMPVQHLETVPGQNRRNMDGLRGRSPGREYPVIPRHPFGDLHGLPQNNLGPELDRRDPYTSSSFFPEPRYPALHSPFQEFGEIRNLRTGEFARNGDQIPHNMMHSNLRRGQPGSHHFRLDEPFSLGSSRDLAEELSEPESFRMGRLNQPQFLEPGFRSSFSLHGFPNDGKYPVDPKSFDNSRKRHAGSMGWCRICKVDCQTVEGLDMHSQTREHQKAAIDIVRSIKQQNAKKQKLSSTNQAPEEGAGKLRTVSADGRGNKP